MSFFSQLRKAASPEKAEAPVLLGSRVVGNLSPIKAVAGGNAINKAGRLVLKGASTGKSVKVFEAANPAHAEFIRSVSCQPELISHLPTVHSVASHLLVLEWIEGNAFEPHSSISTEKMARLLVRFHSTPLTPLPPPEFDYWQDFIKPRFRRAAAFADAKVATKVETEVCEYLAKKTLFLSHPDVTPVNLIVSREIFLISIDNELLCTSGEPIFDVLNSARPLKPQWAEKLLDHYLEGYQRALPPLSVVRSFWLAREAGSAFAAGRIDRLRRLFDAYLSGEPLLSAGLEQRFSK